MVLCSINMKIRILLRRQICCLDNWQLVIFDSVAYDENLSLFCVYLANIMEDNCKYAI